MWPLEFVATATASPRYSPGGSFRKFGTAVNGISGTILMVALRCANAGASANTERATGEMKIRFIEISCLIPNFERHYMRSARRVEDMILPRDSTAYRRDTPGPAPGLL